MVVDWTLCTSGYTLLLTPPLLTLSQEALARRDAEIQRLSAQLAQCPDVDALAQRYRNDANEEVILQLNQQVWGP